MRGGLFIYLIFVNLCVGRANVDEEEYEPCSPLKTCRKKEKEPVNLDEYYSTTAGLTGSALRSELNKIIRDHERYTYTCVWNILEGKNNAIIFKILRNADKHLFQSIF